MIISTIMALINTYRHDIYWMDVCFAWVLMSFAEIFMYKMMLQL